MNSFLLGTIPLRVFGEQLRMAAHWCEHGDQWDSVWAIELRTRWYFEPTEWGGYFVPSPAADLRTPTELVKGSMSKGGIHALVRPIPTSTRKNRKSKKVTKKGT